MPRNKGRRNEANGDFDTSEAEENHHRSSNRSGTTGQDNNGHASGGRSPENKGISSYQLSLGPWTDAVTETVQSMEIAHQAIKDLQQRFVQHKKDLGMMEDTKNRLSQLEEECQRKKVEIENRKQF